MLTLVCRPRPARRAAANACRLLQNQRVASRGHRGDRGKCRGRARAVLHASLREFPTPHVPVSARAAVFHRVFALSCFVKAGRRFALVAGSFRCNGDAGGVRLNCEVFVLDGAESARIRVRELRSSSQAWKQSRQQVQKTSARTHRSAQWPRKWNLARARARSVGRTAAHATGLHDRSPHPSGDPLPWLVER